MLEFGKGEACLRHCISCWRGERSTAEVGLSTGPELHAISLFSSRDRLLDLLGVIGTESKYTAEGDLFPDILKSGQVRR